MRHELVCRDADRRPVGVDVAMQVDQSRRRQLAGGVEHAERARCGDVGFERLDQAVTDADVAAAAQGLGGIEHLGALDHEIELVVRPHGGAGGTGTRGERACAGTGKKFTT